jgi:hypothetical protein
MLRGDKGRIHMYNGIDMEENPRVHFILLDQQVEKLTLRCEEARAF